MKLKVKDMDITTGGIIVVLLNREDAKNFDLHHGDRVTVRKGKKKTVAVLDIAESTKTLPIGEIGLFEETLKKLNAKHGDKVDFDIEEKPKSLSYIKEKLDGKELTCLQTNEIIKDIVEGNLDSIEITYFIAASYTRGLSLKESIDLTNAIVSHGDTLKIGRKPILDKHCTGGVPGNRTTMIVVPIIAAAGLNIPKTSSRSITSPAGTADTMEVLCDVAIPVPKMKSILKKAKGCMVWGGAMNLAAADDKMIKLRHPLSLDPEGMLLASILAKKHAVNSSHVLIDIPLGKDTKIKTKTQAMHLKRKFLKIGGKLGMKIKVTITDGSQPIGNGIGPSLEAIDVLKVLRQDSDAPKDLLKKSLHLATMMLEMAGKKEPRKLATSLLESGKAYSKMKEIIKLQGGKTFVPEDISVGEFTYVYKSDKDGTVISINNKEISRIARIAGAPEDKEAGIYLHKHQKDKVKKGEAVMTVYSRSKTKLKYAIEAFIKFDGIKIR